ncbi:hypothetical protein [Halorubrum sp. F4]|uniref:hypothetical protein n=1 Tax=Halorubrum sp. F4 TaxID=2989715 RepID=UPI0024800410|nr:hypothetical protein [Halorubrum sp. F4]
MRYSIRSMSWILDLASAEGEKRTIHRADGSTEELSVEQILVDNGVIAGVVHSMESDERFWISHEISNNPEEVEQVPVYKGSRRVRQIRDENVPTIIDADPKFVITGITEDDGRSIS